MQETFADLETAWGKGIINGVQFVQVTGGTKSLSEAEISSNQEVLCPCLP